MAQDLDEDIYYEFTKLGSKVMANYNKYIAKDDNLIPCILVATGTFSPVHRMHVINMELSKQHIEENNKKYRVIGGFISPTHDSYCNHKLGDLSIPSIHRIKMLSLALKDNDWIDVSPWHPNQEYMQSINAEVGYIEQMIQTLYAKNNQCQRFAIFYVCGSDLANKCSFNYGFGRYGVCIIQRESDLMLPYHIKNNIYPPVYLIDIPKQYDDIKNVSSTELRYCIYHGKLINHLTFDKVQQYMVENDILSASKLKNILLQSQASKDEMESEDVEKKEDKHNNDNINDNDEDFQEVTHWLNESNIKLDNAMNEHEVENK